MKNIIAIVGSASAASSSHKILEFLKTHLEKEINLLVFDRLKELPHFDPQESIDRPPIEIIALRQIIQDADAVLICTPEYVFSIPSGLKNLLEWCVATTIWMDKPAGIITASTDGKNTHEQLQMLLRTFGASVEENTCLHIPAVKSKINQEGQIADPDTQEALINLAKNVQRAL